MHRVMFCLTSVCSALSIVALLASQDPPVTLLKQDRDGAPAVNLTAAELGALNDPFFNLVLKQDASTSRLSRVEELLQPRADQRRTFVVDENIADPRPGQQRRAVIAFAGSNGSIILGSNVMLSVGFSSEAFPDSPRFIEAWGWDNQRSRYNYYKLDQTGTPDLRKTWKFRGSSVDADMLSAGDRVGTCLQCHINGAPVMKELLFPWSNWHSPAAASNTSYLTSVAPPAERWKVSADPHLAQGRLLGAERLELNIIDAIRQFNTRRLNMQLVRSDATGNVELDVSGRSVVVDGRRLLRPLFEATEVNLISAKQRSGLHPLPTITTTGPGQDVAVPATFFLNANLLSGDVAPVNYKGLGLTRAGAFGGLVIVTPSEYRQLVIGAKLELAGREPGDADFAWFTPEASHVDNDLVDQLLQRGVISRALAAAVLSVDLETPVFSERRAALVKFVPDTFSFLRTGAPHPDELTQAVIAQLERSKPAAGTSEQDFLANLKNADPVKQLEVKIDQYFARIQARLKTNRAEELQRLFTTLVNRRLQLLAHDTLGALDETGDRLLPVPPLSRRPITGSGGQIIKTP